MTIPSLTASEAYKLSVLDHKECSFPHIWRTVSQICFSAFSIFEKEPTKNKTVAYNELCANLCKAHALVYRLTTYKSSDCPALVRGSSSIHVVGDSAESTQVLVVYYLLKEILKKQLTQYKQVLSRDGDDIVAMYIDTFEKFTGGVNLMKSVFTYLHWVWQKRGLPGEHTIFPTEIVSLHLWTELILTDQVKERLKKSTEDTIRAARSGIHVDISKMENIKRLSLNLLMLYDNRQTLYSVIVEDSYLSSMEEFYTAQKTSFKVLNPEKYIDICFREVKKEEERARWFLCPSSYLQVKERLTKILVDKEVEYLRGAVTCWLSSAANIVSVYKVNLLHLYDLLGSDSKKGWADELLVTNVTEHVRRNVHLRAPTENNRTAATLAAVKEVCGVYRDAIIKTFGQKQILLAAVLDGMKAALFIDGDEVRALNVDDVAKCLATCSAEEVGMLNVDDVEKGNWVADIFGVLSEKDVFYFHYTQLLEDRLMKAALLGMGGELSEQSLVYQKEIKMLVDIFEKCGSLDFVMRCKKMLNDIYVESSNLSSITQEEGALIVRPVVLTKFSWKLLTPVPPQLPQAKLEQLYPTVQKILPRLIQRFGATKKGLRASFLPQYSTAVVRIRNLSPHTVKAVVSYQQLRLVYALNRAAVWEVKALSEEVCFSEQQCLELLDPFVKRGIVVLDGNMLYMNDSFGATADEMLYLNPDFGNQRASANATNESPFSMRTIRKEKNPAIESCIVKLLKSQGPQGIEQIQRHVCNQLSSLSVNTRDVKQRLTHLVEREYVERDGDDGSLFKFVP